jgi:hypothetical protein
MQDYLSFVYAFNWSLLPTPISLRYSDVHFYRTSRQIGVNILFPKTLLTIYILFVYELEVDTFLIS